MITASHILTPDTRSIDWRQPVNWADPLNHGLVSWWMAIPNHTAGGSTWRDLCGLNDGTLTNFANVDQAWKTQGQPGGFGALEFDGVSDCVALTRPNIDTRPITILATFRTASRSGYRSVIHNNNNIAYGQGFQTRPTTGELRLMYYQNVWDTGYIVPLDVWQCVVAVYTDTRIDAYVDGVKKNSLTYAANRGSSVADGFRIGAASVPAVTATEFLDGHISDVRIWNRALTASEIQDYYHRSQRYYLALLNRHTRRSVFVPSTGTTITPATLSISAALQGSPPVSSRTIEVT